MDNPLTPEQESGVIEGALRSYPVAQMPHEITAEVLAKIRTTPAPRYRFTRNDGILTVVLAMAIGAMVFGFNALPGHILLQLRIQGILFWQDLLVNARWLIPSLLFGLAALLAALAIPTLIQMTADRQ